MILLPSTFTYTQILQFFPFIDILNIYDVTWRPCRCRCHGRELYTPGAAVKERACFSGAVLLRCRGADKSLARPTSRCIMFDGENISFDASLVIYINSTNIPPIMIINRIYEHQNLLSL